MKKLHILHPMMAEFQHDLLFGYAIAVEIEMQKTIFNVSLAEKSKEVY